MAATIRDELRELYAEPNQRLAKMLPEYRFAPARVRGEPSPIRIEITFYFQQSGAVISLTGAESWTRKLGTPVERWTSDEEVESALPVSGNP